MRFNHVKTQYIVSLYTEKHLTLREIASISGMSHMAVYKRLLRAGVVAKDGEHVSIACDMCGKQFDKYRCKWRKSKEHFCSRECQILSLENPLYIGWRNGGRIARRIVALHFPLEPQHIVHHKDENQRNYDRANLMVFANQSDHLKHHHGKSKVVPLWDGAA